jgi:hypothetical protein
LSNNAVLALIKNEHPKAWAFLKLAALILIIIIVIAGVAFYFLNNMEIGSERPIINQVTPLIEDCRKIGAVGNFPIIEGNIIVWDVEANSKFGVVLPDHYAGVATDKQLTIFLVLDKNATDWGTYAGGAPAYRPYANVAVVIIPA